VADPRERAVVGTMLAAGLERYHVRKPDWSPAEMAEWLSGLPVAWRSRLILHGNEQLALRCWLGGRHWRDDASAPPVPVPGDFASRSCHDLAILRSSLGRYDAVFFGPVFASISKPGRGPRAGFDFAALTALLAARSPAQRRTVVYALGGVRPENVPQCHAMGFDGVAVLGAVWQDPDPLPAFLRLQSALGRLPAKSRESRTENSARWTVSRPIMAITQDGLALGHVEQAAALCAAGARWIQLRVKGASTADWLAMARATVEVCHRHDALCLVNDSAKIALASGADGAHLGRLDARWSEARRQLGPELLLGGTVNDAADAARARASGVLDYVGVGPLRFTSTKRNLSPVLGLPGIAALIADLGDLPAWAIGGVEPGDLAGLRAAGAAGGAVSSGLLREGKIAENLHAYRAAWDAAALSDSDHLRSQPRKAVGGKSKIANRKSPSAVSPSPA
jgi:thiamine-phosphate pyrophosphorylase